MIADAEGVVLQWSRHGERLTDKDCVVYIRCGLPRVFRQTQ